MAGRFAAARRTVQLVSVTTSMCVADIDLLQAVHSVHLTDGQSVKLVEGMEGFPAFQLNGLTNLAFPHIIYFPQMRMYDKFALLTTFQSHSSEGGYLFAILTPVECQPWPFWSVWSLSMVVWLTLSWIRWCSLDCGYIHRCRMASKKLLPPPPPSTGRIRTLLCIGRKPPRPPPSRCWRWRYPAHSITGLAWLFRWRVRCPSIYLFLPFGPSKAVSPLIRQQSQRLLELPSPRQFCPFSAG